MRDSFTVDETDTALVDAISLRPRATWATIASALSIDPATAARRWQRLVQADAAWVTTFPLFAPRSIAAMMDLNCDPSQIAAVVDRLSSYPQIILIAATTGRRHILTTLVAESWAELSRFVLETVYTIPSVRDVATYPIVSHFASGPVRTSALGGKAREQLSSAQRPVGLSAYAPDDLDWAISERLGINGRATASEVANELDASEATVRRRIDNLLSTGCLRLRCDVANVLNPRPWDAWFFAEVPAHRLATIGPALATIPQVVQVTSVTGQHNLVFGVGLAAPEQGELLEAKLTETVPELKIIDRSLSLRMNKLFSRVLDPDGFALQTTSLDFRSPRP